MEYYPWIMRRHVESKFWSGPLYGMALSKEERRLERKLACGPLEMDADCVGLVGYTLASDGFSVSIAWRSGTFGKVGMIPGI